MRPRNTRKLPRQRIDMTTAVFMVVVAAFFDALQFIPKIFYLLATAGSLLVGFIPFIGQAGAVAMMGAALVIDYVFSALITIGAYLTLWLWFKMRDVSIFEGKSLHKKALLLPTTLLFEVVPFLNNLPSITFWVFMTIRITRKEDKEARDKMKKQIAAEELHARRMAQAALAQQQP